MKIAELRAQGMSFKEIGAALGAKESNLRNIWSDPDGSKQRERRKRYQGVCVDCGGPTDGVGGRAAAPMRCRWCAQGKPRPRQRLTVPVRLTDLPVDVRLEGARQASRTEPDQHERLEILLAAVEPSDQVYWVAESARPLLETLRGDAA